MNRKSQDELYANIIKLIRAVENRDGRDFEKALNLASDLRNLGNGGFIALVIARAFSDTFSSEVFVVGGTFLILSYLSASIVERGGGKK